MSGSAERKRHNLAIANLQRERDSWSEQQLACIDFINKKLKEQEYAEKTFRNVDEAILVSFSQNLLEHHKRRIYTRLSFLQVQLLSI